MFAVVGQKEDVGGGDVAWRMAVRAHGSAVHHAAEYGHVEPIRMMQKLYGADLDIDAEDTVGWYATLCTVCVLAALRAVNTLSSGYYL